jgi:hypothetical protein
MRQRGQQARALDRRRRGQRARARARRSIGLRGVARRARVRLTRATARLRVQCPIARLLPGQRARRRVVLDSGQRGLAANPTTAPMAVDPGGHPVRQQAAGGLRMAVLRVGARMTGVRRRVVR